MKSIATLGLALALGSSAYAGETTTATTYSAPPTEAPSLWTWFVGGSAGYLLDNEEEYYTLHLGAKLGESGPLTHSLYLEGAWSEFENLGLETQIVPVTLNYKLDYALTDRFSIYGGVGAGAAFVDTEVGPFSDDSVELAAQIFAGVGYDVTPNFQLYTGARWIWVDDSEIFNVPVDIGDDVGLELGARFKF
jgi:opacity protein-like surface antigen